MLPEDKFIADSLDIKLEVLPYLDYLLQDIWVLGSSPETIVRLVSECQPEALNAKILELGCGKGAVSIQLAQALKIHVDGFDQFEPFLREARQTASEKKLEAYCNFQVGNALKMIHTLRNYDVVIFAAVGPIFGNLEATIAALRQTVKPGGWIIIDDGFLTEDKNIDFPGYELLATREESHRQLTAAGDKLVKEVLIPKSHVKMYNNQNTELIRKRAQELARHYPEKANVFNDYVKKEEDECVLIENDIEGVIWLVQKVAS